MNKTVRVGLKPYKDTFSLVSPFITFMNACKFTNVFWRTIFLIHTFIIRNLGSEYVGTKILPSIKLESFLMTWIILGSNFFFFFHTHNYLTTLLYTETSWIAYQSGILMLTFCNSFIKSKVDWDIIGFGSCSWKLLGNGGFGKSSIISS